MDARVVEAWFAYRGVVDELYVRTEGERLALSVDADPGSLELVVTRSEKLLGLFTELLPVDRDGDEREELETAAYAAAAVDVRIGAEAVVAFLGEADPPIDDASARLIAKRRPTAEELIPVEVLLAQADAAIAGADAVAGASPRDPFALTRAEEAIDDLVREGTPPAVSFAGDIFTAGAGQVFSAVGGLEWLREIADQLAQRLGHGVRLINLGLRKMAATIGVDKLLEAASEWFLERISSAVEARIEPLGEKAVRKVVGAERSRRRTVAALTEQNPHPNMKTLSADLDKLCRHFARNMRWAKRVEKGIAFAGLALVVLGGGPPGQLGVTGVVCVGLVVCLFSLADRLDTLPRRIGWVPGVPAIAARS